MQHKTKKEYDDLFFKKQQYESAYENRKPFEHAVSGDALYEKYKNATTEAAKMAREDTIGQATAMTGGYMNSYAKNMGQQAYDQQIAEGNNIIAELRQLALEKYEQEGEAMKGVVDYLNEEFDSSTFFAGNTYDSAMEYIGSLDLPTSVLNGLMTKQEWLRRKQSASADNDEMSDNSYTEYLKRYVDYAIEMYGSEG